MGCCFSQNELGKNNNNISNPFKSQGNNKLNNGNINNPNNDAKNGQFLLQNYNNKVSITNKENSNKDKNSFNVDNSITGNSSINRQTTSNTNRGRSLIRFTNNNNSYMISILQCLTYTKGLIKYFLSKYHNNNYDKQVSNEYYNLLNIVWKEKKFSTPYPPEDLELFINDNNSLFNNNKLNDGKTLLKYLFENIHKELNIIGNYSGNNNQYEDSINQLNKEECFQSFYTNFKNNYNSIISYLFYGIKEIKYKCTQCEKINYKYEFFNFIEFLLNEITSDLGISSKASIENDSRFQNSINKIDLYECFNYINKEKSLTTKDYKCANCINNEYFEFSTSLFSTPKYLILFLNYENEDTSKYNVNYPEQLDLYNYIIHKKYAYKFDLYAVISKNINDYFSYCRDLDNYNIWYKYKGKEVSKCENNEYLSALPYCLFYKLKNK